MQKEWGLAEEDEMHQLPSLDRLVKPYLRRHEDMVQGNIIAITDGPWAANGEPAITKIRISIIVK